MPYLWRELAGAWSPAPLDEGAVPIAGAGAAALLLRSRSPAGEEWFVLAVPEGGVDLNGAPLRTGIRQLEDRDLLAVRGVGRLFFSAERLAAVEPFPGTDAPMYCPRDRRALAAGEPAVQCPASCCRVWHHAECWSYAETCALCDQPTALDAGFRWTPDALGAAAPNEIDAGG